MSIWTKTSKLIRLARSRAALALARMRLGSGGLPGDLSLAEGVCLRVTDGGSLSIGPRSSIDRGATLIVKHGALSIGADAYVGIGTVIVARESVRIGAGALIAEHVSIRDQDHAMTLTEGRGRVGFTSSPVVIGDNVWLGAKVTVIQGVTIGNNVVVGANSVVTRDLPDNCVAVGAPARVVRQLTVG